MAGRVSGENAAVRPGGRPGPADVNIGAGFEAVFIDPVGRAVQQRWADAAVAVAFEDPDPVSAFPVVPGRRWGPGLLPPTCRGRRLRCGGTIFFQPMAVRAGNSQPSDLVCGVL